MARNERLFERWRRRGDAAALGRLFDRTASELLRVAMHFARNPAEAEDLLQETFLTAIERAATYDAARPVVPWLVGILRNHVRTLWRKRSSPANEEGTSDAEASDAADSLEVAEWTEALASAVEALPAPYRQVLVLRWRQGMAPAEIAALLGLPPATVRSQIHRGMALLRRELSPAWAPMAAFPIGAGLEAIRSRVLAKAAQAAAASGGAVGGVVVLGGALVANKTVLAASVAAVALLAVGGAAILGVFGPSRTPAGDPPAQVRTLPQPPEPGATAPTLAGTLGGESAPAPAGTAQTGPPTSPGSERVPLDAPVPPGKGSVAGRVRFEDGTPLVDTPLSLWGSSEIVSRTDAEGSFHIHGDWVAERSLYVRKDGDYHLLLGAPVQMVADQRVEVDLTIARGMDVASVVSDAITGEPIGGVSVVLRRPGLSNVQAVAGFAETDAEGRFRFEYLPRVLYTLALSHAGHLAIQAKFDLATDPWPERLQLAPSRPLVLEIRGLPREAAGDVVSWMLQQPDAFEVVEGGALRRTGDQLSLDGKATLDARGRLTLDAPSPGRYHLTLFTSPWVPRTERDLDIPDGPVPPVVIQLEPRARVTGVVVDAEGRFLGEVGISIGAAQSVRTDAAGRFEFHSVPSGGQPVRLRKEEASVIVGSVDVPTSGAVEARVVVPGSSTIEGQVRIGENAPKSSWEAGLRVRNAATRKHVAEANVDAYGKFRVPFLEAGEYEILAFSGEALPETRVVQVAAGEIADAGTIRLDAPRFPVRFLLPPGATLPPQVSVWAEDAAASAGSHMPATREVGGQSFVLSIRVVRDADGKSWLVGLPPGSWRLRFTAEGLLPAVAEISLRPGDVPSIEVRFERP